MYTAGNHHPVKGDVYRRYTITMPTFARTRKGEYNGMKISLGSALDRSGITQAELARRTGVTRGFVSLVVAGKKTPSVDLLGKMAAAMGLSIADIAQPETAPARAAGFAESAVEPIATDAASLQWQAIKALNPSLRQPALYRLKHSQPGLFLMPGDVLVLDLARKPTVGDTVVITALDKNTGSVQTAVRRFLERWLLTGDPADPPEPIDPNDESVAVLGVIASVLRGLLPPHRMTKAQG